MLKTLIIVNNKGSLIFVVQVTALNVIITLTPARKCHSSSLSQNSVQKIMDFYEISEKDQNATEKC